MKSEDNLNLYVYFRAPVETMKLGKGHCVLDAFKKQGLLAHKW